MKILQIDIEWNDDGVSPRFEARVLDRSGNPHYNVTGDRVVDVLRDVIDSEAEAGFQSRQAFVARPQEPTAESSAAS